VAIMIVTCGQTDKRHNSASNFSFLIIKLTDHHSAYQNNIYVSNSSFLPSLMLIYLNLSHTVLNI
jgi:hypothetical protein